MLSTTYEPANNPYENGYVTITYTLPDPDPPCLLAVNSVFLHNKIYKPISQITNDDSIYCPLTKTSKKVKRCFYEIVNYQTIDENNFIHKIPKGHFDANTPEKDVHISGFHRIYFKVKEYQNYIHGEQTFKVVPKGFKITDENILLEITGENELRYYHLELEDGKGAMLVDGLVVETF